MVESSDMREGAPEAGESEKEGLSASATLALQHALNNPLTVVIANLDFALESALSDEVSEVLRQARAAAEQLRIEIRSLGDLQPASIPPPGIENASSETRVRVLLVDDNEMVLRSLKRALRDCDVTALLDPRAAVALIEEGKRFDAILCDLTMPEMTGIEVHQALVTVAPEQARRMIFLTGGVTAEQALDAISQSGVPLLRKPFDVDRLRTIIRTRKREP